MLYIRDHANVEGLACDRLEEAYEDGTEPSDDMELVFIELLSKVAGVGPRDCTVI